MRTIWDRITLMKYATEENDGRITPDKVLVTVLMFLGACGGYLMACALVRG